MSYDKYVCGILKAVLTDCAQLGAGNKTDTQTEG